MFEAIRNEILKAAEAMDNMAVLKLAPVYLIDNKEERTAESFEAAGEELIEELEKNEIFDVLHDAFVSLNVVQQYKVAEKTQYDIGLTDSYDNFVSSLREWIERLSIQNHIRKGVIFISISDHDVLLEHEAWWKSMLRTIGLYKESFIFIFSAAKDAPDIKDEVSRHQNCKLIPLKDAAPDELYDVFVSVLKKNGFCPDADAKKAVREAIEMCSVPVSAGVISLWAENILWEKLVSGGDGTQGITKNDIDLSYLKLYASYDSKKSSKPIGFK